MITGGFFWVMRRFFCVLLAAAGVATVVASFATGAFAGSGGAAIAASPAVSVFPSPGTQYAEPGAQIVFRGIPAGAIGQVKVVGSKSGNHNGHTAADSDGNGGSWLPNTPFTPGETVTVNTNTNLNVINGNHGSWQFKVANPAGPIKAIRVAHVPGPVQRFHSRPDLRPSTVRILKIGARPRQGNIFVAPQYGPSQDGPMLMDTSGNLIWFHPVPRPELATDFKVQRYHNQGVLTWWQGNMSNGSGRGQDIIFNNKYQQIATVNAANGLQGSDLHEFLLTNSGDAYITAVFPIQWPGTNKPLMDSVVQEIDVKTGLVLFEWDALDHIPISDSYFKSPKHPGYVWDPFHVNSVKLDIDGNLLISVRQTWAFYKVNHSTGGTMWTFGSGHSTFKQGPGTRMVFQHDVEQQRNGDFTIFDDGAGPPRKESQSRAIRISINTSTNTARLVRQYTHSPSISSNYEGNMQMLGDGDAFVGWGQPPYVTEFGPNGKMDFDMRFGSATDTYRAYRFPWAAQPPTQPAIAVSRGRHGVSTVYASWNGDTTAAAYRVLGGSSPSSMSRLRIVKRHGFETALAVHSTSKYFEVQALGSKSNVLATSKAIS